MNVSRLLPTKLIGSIMIVITLIMMFIIADVIQQWLDDLVIMSILVAILIALWLIMCCGMYAISVVSNDV